MKEQLIKQLTTVWRITRFLFKRLWDDELTFYASSLSFYTIFTFIPLLLIILSVVTNMPSFFDYYEKFESFIFSNFIPVHTNAITKYINEFLQNSFKLGAIGFAMILMASLLFFQNYEQITAKIYHTKKRGFWSSITTYWTLLTLTPIALLVSIFLSASLNSFVTTHEAYAMVADMMHVLPYLIIWALFFLIYQISANITIHHRATLITSFVISLVWTLAKNAFIYYVFYNKVYTTLYGSFSILIFFFLWIYVSWIIFIYGFRLSYLINRIYRYCHIG